MVTWNTFRDVDQLRRELDVLLESFFVPMSRSRRNLMFLPGYSARKYPLVNLYEESDQFIVEALAPGINPEKLDLSIVGNVLTLSGEKTRLPENIQPEAYHRSERAAGRFVRTIELPTIVDSAKITAEYKNGILQVTLPKAEEAKPKTIRVQVS